MWERWVVGAVSAVACMACTADRRCPREVSAVPLLTRSWIMRTVSMASGGTPTPATCTGTAPLRRYFLQTAKSKESEGHALHGVQYFVTDKEDDHAHLLFQFTLFM